MKKNLWIFIGRIGIGMMFLIIPLQVQAASMLVDLVSSGTADGGTVLSKTRYDSMVVGEENIRENQYSTSKSWERIRKSERWISISPTHRLRIFPAPE